MTKRTWALGRSLEAQTEKYDYYVKATCPKCGAQPDEWCTTNTGLVCFEPHKRRIEHARNTVPVSEYANDVEKSVPAGMPVYMTVNTYFGLYKVTYQCTHAYPDERHEEGDVDEVYVIAKSLRSVEYWFNSNFNRNGSIFYIKSVEDINMDKNVDFNFADYVEDL